MTEPTSEELKRLLLATHLHYDCGVQHLADRALAELTAKALFGDGSNPKRSIKFSEVRQQLVEMTGASDVPKKNVHRALHYLHEHHFVVEEPAREKKSGNTWRLRASYHGEIAQHLQAARARRDTIIARYFPTDINSGALRGWFSAAGSDYFGECATVWVKLLKGRKAPPLPGKEQLHSILKPSIDGVGLSKEANRLVACFQDFLSDFQDPEVARQIWSFAQAMFSARLIQAGLGSDVLALEIFKDAYFLLDTNVLLLAALPEHQLAEAFDRLSAVLGRIGARMVIVHPTRSEYEGVLAGRRGDILAAVTRLPSDYLEKSGSQFIRTAISLGAKTREDFECFLDSIRIPDLLKREDIRIDFEDNPEIAAAAERGAADEERIRQIADEAENFPRPRPKSIDALRHDSALDEVCKDIRQQEINAFVVTIDRSMPSWAARSCRGDDMPRWVHLGALVQMVAAGAGPEHNPEEFAPLFATIIGSEMQVRDNVFDQNELLWLAQREEQGENIVAMNKQAVIDLLNRIARLRIAGKPRNDPEFVNALRVIGEQGRGKTEEEIAGLRGSLQEAVIREGKAKKQTEAAIGALASEIAIRKTQKVKRRWFWIGAGVVVVAAVLVLLAYAAFRAGNQDLGWSFLLAAVLGAGILLLTWVIPARREGIQRAQQEAKQEARTQLNIP